MPRKATWALIIWTALAVLLVWGTSQATGQVDTTDCQTELGTSTCRAVTQIAGGIWVVMISAVWFIGFVVLGIIWLGSRPQRRLCPVCGHQIKKGIVVCSRCGYDFRAAAGMPPMPVGPPLGWGQVPPAGPPPGWWQAPPQGQMPPPPDRWPPPPDGR